MNINSKKCLQADQCFLFLLFVLKSVYHLFYICIYFLLGFGFLRGLVFVNTIGWVSSERRSGVYEGCGRSFRFHRFSLRRLKRFFCCVCSNCISSNKQFNLITLFDDGQRFSIPITGNGSSSLEFYNFG